MVVSLCPAVDVTCQSFWSSLIQVLSIIHCTKMTAYKPTQLVSGSSDSQL